MNDNSKKLYDMDMDKVSGGWDGEYGYVGSCNCTNCGATNSVNRYCYSGQTTWNCQSCGKTFTIRF